MRYNTVPPTLLEPSARPTFQAHLPSPPTLLPHLFLARSDILPLSELGKSQFHGRDEVDESFFVGFARMGGGEGGAELLRGLGVCDCEGGAEEGIVAAGDPALAGVVEVDGAGVDVLGAVLGEDDFDDVWRE